MNKTELSHIETLENAVKWDYFKRVLNWTTDKIAYEMYVNERRLREWTNGRAAVITKLIKSDVGRVKAIRKNLEKDYPLPKAESRKERKIEKLNCIQVVKKYKEGNSLAQLAKIFKCPLNDFRRWWNDNLHVINQEFRKVR